MTIPDYQTIMLPLLKFVSTRSQCTLDEAAAHISATFNLTAEERAARIPSGQSTFIKNRTGWARTYLKKAGLLTSPKRGVIQITDRGREVLSRQPSQLDNTFLNQFPEFVAFRTTDKRPSEPCALGHSSTDGETPEVIIEKSYLALRAQLADELLDQIKGCSPDFFERLVVDVIVGMGYGGSHRDAASATKRSHDGGIDGIINQDRLGLDTIYIQAKKWDQSRVIHRPEIQKFAGALQGVRARKGIFITTTSFSEGARGYVTGIDSKIILIDGSELAELMIDFGVGVTPHHRFEINRLDSDYFED